MKEAAPVQTRMPAIAHTRTATPGEGVCEATWEGAEKIPEPIWRPITRASPFVNVSGILAGSLVRGSSVRKESSSWSEIWMAIGLRGMSGEEAAEACLDVWALLLQSDLGVVASRESS